MHYLRLTTIIVLTFLTFESSAQTQQVEEPTKKEVKKSKKNANEDTFIWRYEIEPIAEGRQGTYQIKVWSYSSVVETAIEQAKKNAVHGIIFRGYQSINGQKGQPALTSNPNLEIEFQDFFRDFFADGGKYMKFISVTGNGALIPTDLIKIGKEYKVGVVVNVLKENLRKDLEAAGILKALSSGF